MFSGQGSQYYQMGRALYEQGETFARQMRDMDQIVRDLGCPSVVGALYGDHAKGAPFDDLRVTHPAIFMVEYALARTLIEMGIEPGMTLGVSLGSVAAAVVAGCLHREEALSWVVRYASWIVGHCEPGGMIGVLAPPELHNAEPLRTTSVIAAQNGRSHWVLSARERDLAGIEGFLKSRDVTFARLPVRYAFHSPWLMADSSSGASLVRPPAVELPCLPIACCWHGGVISSLPSDYFWQTAVKPIQFERTIRSLEAWQPDGAAYRYVDLSPSATLATLLKYLLPGESACIQAVLSPYGRDVANLTSLARSVEDEARS